ncbi:MAG: LytTR family DNA-binding domain-containing protein [Candidatus Paceibacterota bacterium]
MITRHNGRYVKLISREIEYCKADKSYTYVKIRGQNYSLLICKNISYFENMLGSDFLRIHRSYLVNIEFINSFSSHKGIVKLESLTIPISRRKLGQIVGHLLDCGICDKD